ncbi:hypothetical protein E2C01_054382 [Portunus trituberculatus]|uniref:Uncharacterized protein n=1 Tax=Portunus trituberculatus TaxID=210409 RepID=A0A5B7GJ79_PORTR|nr:hypothetical protein [Portunus trituberculatus]
MDVQLTRMWSMAPGCQGLLPFLTALVLLTLGLNGVRRGALIVLLLLGLGSELLEVDDEHTRVVILVLDRVERRPAHELRSCKEKGNHM